VEESAELFLQETFTPMDNKTTRMFEENVLFQTPPPHLINDCGMLKDCRSGIVTYSGTLPGCSRSHYEPSG